MTTATLPLPTGPPRMAPFWAAALEERLLIQSCCRCSKKHFPAVEFCDGCLAEQLEWVQASGHGSVFSFVVMHQLYHQAFADRLPYAVIEVKLDEGPRMISSLRRCEPSAIRIGMPVRVEFERLNDEISLPLFRPR